VSLPPIKEYPHIFGPDEYEWAEQISAGFLSQFGSGRSVIDAMSDQSAEQDDYVQDTQGARVIASDEAAHTADVVMFADEVCLAHQELTNDPALLPDYFALDANPANSPRHMAWRFTAGHNAIPKFLELQLRCQSDLAVVAAGRAWVAIYRDNGMGTAPGALLVTMDSRVGARIPNSTWILCLLWADWEVTLVAGTRYWIAVCTSDPMGSGGQWGTTDMWVRRRDDVFPLFADPTVMDTASDDFPSGGAYSSHVDRRPWFRLYECRHTLNDVPMAENATAPSRGELVSMRRIQGMHPQREIIGPFAGQTAGRIYTTPRTGGGAGSFQIFTPGSIPFAGASGVLTEDNPNLFWDDAANRLGIGTNAPATALHVYGAANIRATIEATDSASYAIYVLGTDNSTTAAFITAYGSTHAGQANELAFKNNYGLIAFYPGTAGATTRRMALTNTPQLLGSDGVVASPFYSFATELGMGMYRVALNQLGLAAGGVLALTLTNTPQALLVSGVVASPGLGFAAEAGLGMYRVGAGQVGWPIAGVLQMALTADALYLRPHAPALAAEGWQAMDSTHATLRWFMGGMQCLGASLVDDALVATATVVDVGGTLALTNVALLDTPAAFSVSGNSIHVVARGTAKCQSNPGAPAASLDIQFRIEGTVIFTLTLRPAIAETHWKWFEFEFDATIRGAASWMISRAKARFYDWVGAAPWPALVGAGLMSELSYVWETPFVVAGQVTSYVRCQIANGNPGNSYCSVIEFKQSLEDF